MLRCWASRRVPTKAMTARPNACLGSAKRPAASGRYGFRNCAQWALRQRRICRVSRTTASRGVTVREWWYAAHLVAPQQGQGRTRGSTVCVVVGGGRGVGRAIGITSKRPCYLWCRSNRPQALAQFAILVFFPPRGALVLAPSMLSPFQAMPCGSSNCATPVCQSCKKTSAATHC